MELNKYMLISSKVLLKKLCELSNDKKLLNYYTEYDKNISCSENVDYSWVLISTALLLSEHLWKKESVYKNIDDASIERIEDEISIGNNPIKGDMEFTNNCLLDSNNIVANAINIDEIQDVYRLDTIEMLRYKKNKSKNYDELDSIEQSRLDFLDDIFLNDVYGCNDSLLTDNRIDYRKFILRTRHALAHSNYEIIDDKFIRLYHYNKSEKKLDFNVVLTKKLVITILDELNEMFNERGKEIIEKWNDFTRVYKRHNFKELNEEEVLNEMLSYDILNLDECREVIKNAKMDKDYKKSDSIDRLDIIFESLLNKIRPLCSYGIIINEFIYGNNNGLMDEDYYVKFDYYDYFNSELFDINMDSNPDSYNKHKFELYLLAFLNCALLNGVNLNNNNIIGTLDFSKMDFDLYKVEHDMNKKELTDLLNRFEKLEKQIVDLDAYISKRKKLLDDNKHINNDFYNNKLPLEIKHFLKVKGNYLVEQNQILSLLQDIDLQLNDNKKTNFILTHLRNSLAHGYIKINDFSLSDNIYDIEMTFLDFEPDDKNKNTFEATVKFGDLLSILTSNVYVNNIYNPDIKKCSL